MTVQIYFPTTPGDPDERTEANPLCLGSVQRVVPNNTPAHGVVKSLLAGPTQAEFDNGFLPLDCAHLKIGMVTIRDRICRVTLDPTSDFEGFVSDLSRLALRECFVRSLVTFDTIDRVIVSLEL